MWDDDLKNTDINKELAVLEMERIMSEKAIEGRKNEMANMLLGDMGKDMEDFLSGRKTIKIKKRGFFRRMADAFDSFLRKISERDGNGEQFYA